MCEGELVGVYPLFFICALPGAMLADRSAYPSLPEFFSEWGKCQAGKFELLVSKRNPYNGDTKQNTEQYVCQKNPKATNKYPDNIHYKVEATQLMLFVNNLCSEWPQDKHPDFKRLKPERDSNNGDHQSDTGNKILYCDG